MAFGKICLGLVAGALLAAPAAAWDGAVSIKPTRIDTTDGNNYAFRVYGPTPMCGDGTPTWAYMNASWDNYQATAALITSVWLAGRTIIVFSMKDNSGYCRLSYVATQ